MRAMGRFLRELRIRPNTFRSWLELLILLKGQKFDVISRVEITVLTCKQMNRKNSGNIYNSDGRKLTFIQ